MPSVKIKNQNIPVLAANTIVVGAGAAGMNAAVQLARQWRARGVEDPAARVRVVTGGLALGASRMSGSDKQTYYKLGTSPDVPDCAADYAGTLTAAGCCHGDTALAEGLGSLRAFYHLVDLGVPFPHDAAGTFVGYKTDHDPAQRATSAGPKTSRFMSHCLQAETERLGVQIVDRQGVVQFLTDGDGPDKRIVAMLCIDTARAGKDDLGLSAFVADNWILAAGGPGDLYETTVYPPGQIGLHGPALQAGLVAENLTESQFGLASITFRWNVSGTYMQAIPRIFSTAADGQSDGQEFLAEYFTDMSDMATAIFLKGYQWPFDAQRIVNHQSSLIDMAVHQETVVRGRRVWMDFRGNPRGRGGWQTFDLRQLHPEALDYLEKAGAVQLKPIDRLEHMNPPAIDIYTEHHIDLRTEPLEIAVCAQHMNGGFAVDAWWRSNLANTFVVGEMAGTHGVKRPGGAALNAGQVGAQRAAEFIAHARAADPPTVDEEALATALTPHVQRLEEMLAGSEGPAPDAAMDEIKRRMTHYGAHLRSRAGVDTAVDEAAEQHRRLTEQGMSIASPRQLLDAVRARQQCLAHLAVLKSIQAMLDRNAGSRGSHCILDDVGDVMHPDLINPETDEPYRFAEENVALRNVILRTAYDPAAEHLFATTETTPRPAARHDTAFETAWKSYRNGDIYKQR